MVPCSGTAQMEPERSSCPAVVDGYQLRLEDMMNNRFVVSLIAALLLASGAAYAQSTTATGAASGAAAGGSVAGPVGAAVGGTVGAAGGAGLENPNTVVTSIQGERGPTVGGGGRGGGGGPRRGAGEMRA